MTPATAASAEPIMKVIEMTMLTSMPTRPAMMRSWEVARMALPILVLETKTCRTIMIRIEALRMNICAGETLAPRTLKPSDGSWGGRFLNSLTWDSMTKFWRMIDMPTA